MTAGWLRKLLPGAAVAAVGLFVAAVAAGYPMGSAFRPGPGYFPMLVGGLLVALGLCVVVEDRLRGAEDDTDSDGDPGAARPTWRPLLATSAALLVFALTLERIGYVPAAILLVVIAAFGERRHNWGLVAAIAAFMAVFGTLVFILGLGLPIDPFVVP